MSATDGIQSRGNLYYVSPDDVVVREGWNPRFDMGDLIELATSIKANGFYASKPLLVRRNAEKKFELVDGHRRYAAVQMALKEGFVLEKGIPVIMEDRNISDLDALVHTFTANDGKPFLPLEEAEVYKRLREEHGLTLEQIHERTGRSTTHISATIGLLTLDASVQQDVKDGKVSATLARTLAKRVKSKDQQREIAEKVKKGGQDKKEVKEQMEFTGLRRASTRKLEKMLAELEEEIKPLLKDAGWNARNVHKNCGQTDVAFAAYTHGLIMATKVALGQAEVEDLMVGS